MLRLLVAALVLANLVFHAFTQGWLDSVLGVRAIGDREPERALRQVRPETVRILAAASPGPAMDPAPVAATCFEAGPFSDTELASAQAAAQALLPAGSWVATRVDVPGVWLVYIGRYADREAMTRKQDELRRRRLEFEEIRDPPALDPGLSLGRFEQRTGAVKALDELTQQGLRAARVVEFAAATSSHRLRVERADALLAERLRIGRDTVLGKSFVACAAKAPGP